MKDGHLHAMLTVVNPQKVKAIKLSNCMRLEGSGLNPLRGSMSLKLIDLSCEGDYTGGRGYTSSQEPRISEANVLPILSSILDSSVDLLKYIKFPEKWRTKY